MRERCTGGEKSAFDRAVEGMAQRNGISTEEAHVRFQKVEASGVDIVHEGMIKAIAGAQMISTEEACDEVRELCLSEHYVNETIAALAVCFKNGISVLDAMTREFMEASE